MLLYLTDMLTGSLTHRCLSFFFLNLVQPNNMLIKRKNPFIETLIQLV